VTPQQTENAAQFLLNLRRQGSTIPELPPEHLPRDLDEAYGIQGRLVELIGKRVVGWFLGGTQSHYEDTWSDMQPFAAAVLEGNLVEAPVVVSKRDFLSWELDVEFGFRFGSDMPPRDEPYTTDDVTDAITALYPTIDLANCRYDDIYSVSWPSVLADNGVDGMVVFGAPVHVWRGQDLARSGAQLVVNGEVVRSGSGAAIMGNPVNAAVWFVNHQSRRGLTVRNGEFLTTGSCAELYVPEPGDNAVADFGALGKIALTFTD
jgi:2-keto-4-pentenoate hydratase